VADQRPRREGGPGAVKCQRKFEMSPHVQSRDDTLGRRKQIVRNGMSAKCWGEVEGVKGRGRLAASKSEPSWLLAPHATNLGDERSHRGRWLRSQTGSGPRVGIVLIVARPKMGVPRCLKWVETLLCGQPEVELSGE
jgi:hypothetical protein